MVVISGLSINALTGLREVHPGDEEVVGSSSGHQAKAVSLGRLCFAAVIAPRGLTPGAASFLTICGSLANYKM